MNKLCLFLVASLLSYPIYAQEQYSQKKCNFGGGIELTSKYMWRGLECASGPTIFPTLSFSTGGFSASALGAYAFDNSIREVDLSIGYTVKGFSIGLVDYFYPSAEGMKDSYFIWEKDKTDHLLEAVFSYCFDKIPLYVMWSTMFYGADYNLEGNQAYSSYLEIGYSHNFGENNEISATLGASVLKGMYTLYDQDFSIVNIAAKYTKTFDFGVISIPLSASYIINPYMEKSYLTVSVGANF